MKKTLLFLLALSVSAPALAAKSARKAFHESWRFYEWRVEQGDELVQLEDILRRILRKYRGRGVNLAKVRRELTRVQAVKTAAAGAEQP